MYICDSICTSGIFRFKHHLARIHNNVSACGKVPRNVRLQFSRLLEANDMATKKREVYFQSMKMMRRMRGILEEIICRILFFYTSAIPFNCVKNPEFHKIIEMVSEFGRGLNPPSYREIWVTLLKKEVDYIKSLMEDYKRYWKKTGYTLTSNGWSDRKNRSICNFLVNSPRGTIFLESIDTFNIINIKSQITLLKKIGEKNVVQAVTDNAVNYKAAREMLMKKRKKIFWTPCVVDCIDLMSRLISLLKEFTKGIRFLRPGAIRFATTYLTLGFLYELKGPPISMFTSEIWLSKKYARTKAINNIQATIMDHVLRLVNSDTKPAMGFIYQAMYEAIHEITNEKWYNQLNRALHVIGYILNPGGLYMFLERMCGDDENLAKTIDCQFDQFTNARVLFGLNVAKLTRKEKTPIDCCDLCGADTPKLRNFSMRILNLTCSSSDCERNLRAFEMKGTWHDQTGLETLKVDDVSLDDEWISEEESSHQHADEIRKPMMVLKIKNFLNEL
uniref:DUF659 domain-containing protein n=1 Tax=Lactuca sativa TaxID=4236 RepID=A0A9R1WDJ9_LACSA|nr:hypothetical protein LSAT_V11C200055810 [Lactuca sativa]